ncbi:MAG TPA: hypothetical protein VHO70_04215 [Chitinispirillaceae bacterium]|nr:hypothetical protein [Chitinispirillaceae bacterium]
MSTWTLETLSTEIEQFSQYSSDQKQSILQVMNSFYPPQTVEHQRSCRRRALANTSSIKHSLDGAGQEFPSYILPEQLHPDTRSLKKFGLVFTAGGEGERLRLSLLKRGVSAEKLEDFTKATFPLPDFYGEAGTLHINLAMISSFCRQAGIEIPVVITTGPEGSITAKVIPQLLNKYNNFGLKYVRVVAQEERLHFTNDEKIVFTVTDGKLMPATQPDETGGPLMKLKKRGADGSVSVLEWFESLGCSGTILMQATAVYEQTLLPMMAEALGNHDCCGVGIMRKSFPENDPFGTYVQINKNNQKRVLILEQDMRNPQTRAIMDPVNSYYLPYNTGFYAFNNSLLIENDLPDFATPPKEILPELPRSPKIGYAATDLIAKAKKPVVLAIDQSMFGVLKTADDLGMLSELGKKFGLESICRKS